MQKNKADDSDNSIEMECLDNINHRLSDEMLFYVFMFLPVNELLIAKFVSLKWKRVLTERRLWAKKLTPQQHRQLNYVLYQAVLFVNSALVSSYCQMDANVNVKCNFSVKMNQSFFSSRYGNIFKPSLLHVAANRCSGENGLSIVKTLLYYGANFGVTAKIVEFMGTEHGPVGKFESAAWPAGVAIDSKIKAILILAEFELLLKLFFGSQKDVPIDQLLSKLCSAFKYNCDVVKKYLKGMEVSQEKFQGLQHQFKAEDLKGFIKRSEFQGFYRELNSSLCLMM